MASPFKVIITGDQKIDRIQANISSALSSFPSTSVITVDSNNYSLNEVPGVLMIPTTSIFNGGSGVNTSLPDASKFAGEYFLFKKTDTSSNPISFTTTFKNKQGNQQTIENSTIYTTSSSLASGIIFSDSNNWWVVA